MKWSPVNNKPVRVLKIIICLTIIFGTLQYVKDIDDIELPSHLSVRLTTSIWKQGTHQSAKLESGPNSAEPTSEATTETHPTSEHPACEPQPATTSSAEPEPEQNSAKPTSKATTETYPASEREMMRAQKDDKLDKSYFVDTSGCKMPSFPVINEQIREYVQKEEPIDCKQPPLTKSNNTHLWIPLNITEIEQMYGVEDVEMLNCSYQPFYRETDYTNQFGDQHPLRYGDIVQITAEFVRVTCVNGTADVIYLDYHLFVPFPKTNSSRDPNLDETADKESGHKKINVLIIGIDAVSRLNFKRQMPRTADVILKQLKAVELLGYNKVADNTYPNLIPALTGLNESELTTACLPYENSTFDECHFIWERYKKNGYTTLFAEDMAWLGLFHYCRNGFTNQAQDYNIRPAIVEMERNIGSQKPGNCHLCLGGRRTVDVLLDYINKFIDSIGNMPYFSFFWTTSYTHDELNFPQLIDNEFVTFLNNLSSSDALNNTFLLLMSDHGLRWGSFRNTYQGMMEERQPFLYLIPPKWFPDKYPMAMQNLLLNKRKLTTHFDLHETLNDLLEVQTISTHAIKERTQDLINIHPMPRGISLFLPVPPSRTCYLAGIPTHFCTCHEKELISTSDTRVVRVAEKIVQDINKMLKTYPQCETLSLNTISFANLGISNQDIVGDNSRVHFSDLTVQLKTIPGFAQFEATVRLHPDGDMELTGTISRANLYGNQSHCVDVAKMKLYCFCRTN